MAAEIVFSFIAERKVLSEVIPPNDFIGTAFERAPASDGKFTDTCDGFRYSYLVQDDLVFCAVAVLSAGPELPMAFLERIKEDFTNNYGGAKAAATTVGPKKKPDEISELAEAVPEGVVMVNTDKVLEHAETFDSMMVVLLKLGALCLRGKQLIQEAKNAKKPLGQRIKKLKLKIKISRRRLLKDIYERCL